MIIKNSTDNSRVDISLRLWRDGDGLCGLTADEIDRGDEWMLSVE